MEGLLTPRLNLPTHPTHSIPPHPPRTPTPPRPCRIADHSAKNKMPSSNLGAVFGPTLMGSRVDHGVAYLGHQTTLVETLILEVDVVFAR